MSLDANPNKLLKYLLQQSGGERDSSLKNLSRAKLIEALKVSMQKLDQQQVIKEPGTSNGGSAHAAVSIAPPIQIKAEDSVMCELGEKRGGGRKRKTEPLPTLSTNANKRYRTRSKTAAAVMRSDFKSLSEKKPYHVAIKKEADEDVPSDNMNDQICDGDATRAVKHEAQETSKDVSTFVASLSFKELQVIMSFPEHRGTVYLRNTNKLQYRTQIRLSRALRRTLRPLGGLSKFSQHVAEDADVASKYLDKSLCISSSTAGCDVPAESLRPGKDPMFACERCVQAKKLCLYLITYEEELVLCMVRQPEETCTGANWRRWGYWVRQDVGTGEVSTQAIKEE